CGDVYAPTFRPSARSSAAIVRVAVDFPFVPTTWIDGYARCGSPSARTNSRIRSSPNSSGHGESDSIQLVAESVELTAVALEFFALGFDDIRRRFLDEALVREHLLTALYLVAQPLDLGGCIAVSLHAFRLDDRVEDSRCVSLERYANAAAPEHLRRLLHRLQGVGVRRVRAVGLRPARDDQTRLAVGQVGPDLL